MLGVKTSCKDRWRQVLSEANRVPEKHLLTLESPISVAQTDEMRDHRIQLVIPRPLHEPFKPQQQHFLMSLADFAALARERERRGPTQLALL